MHTPCTTWANGIHPLDLTYPPEPLPPPQPAKKRIYTNARGHVLEYLRANPGATTVARAAKAMGRCRILVGEAMRSLAAEGKIACKTVHYQKRAPSKHYSM